MKYMIRFILIISCISICSANQDKEKMFDYIKQKDLNGLKRLLALHQNDKDFINAGIFKAIKLNLKKDDVIFAELDHYYNNLSKIDQDNQFILDALNRKIDINSVSKKRMTPLMTAVVKNQEDSVEYLLEDPKIDVNFQTEDAENALILAVLMDNEKMVSLLLNAPKIDVNLQHDHNNALMFALDHHNKNIIKLLLKSPSIKFSLKNPLGKTVFDIVEDSEYNDPEITKLIQSYKPQSSIDLF